MQKVCKKGSAGHAGKTVPGAVWPLNKQDNGTAQQWDNKKVPQTRPGVPSGTVADILCLFCVCSVCILYILCDISVYNSVSILCMFCVYLGYIMCIFCVCFVCILCMFCVYYVYILCIFCVCSVCILYMELLSRRARTEPRVYAEMGP